MFPDPALALPLLPAVPVPSPELLVRTATGWPGLFLIFVYSVLVAVVLPFPGELVLLAPIDLGLPGPGELTLIVLVSAVGKAAGSVLALFVGETATRSGPVRDLLARLQFDWVRAVEARFGDLVREHGHVGLVLALSVPGAPDTASIYAFSTLDSEYDRFAAAAFVGTVVRLVVVVGLVGGLLAVF